MTELTVNKRKFNVDDEGDTPLLWVIRDTVGYTGTKFGCGVALCGACTVHVNGEAVRSCSVTLDQVKGKSITTIEGLPPADGHLTKIQQAWIAEEVPQCGYCQPGFIMATAALLKKHPKPTDAQIDANVTNVCRCGTYSRIRKAIHRAANA
jgi:isoquinoline 1-oxidoreductase alpha subunit